MLSHPLLAALLLAQAPASDSLPTLRALQVSVETAAPTMDGRLDEPLWEEAEVASDFVQSSPTPGAPSTHPTTARVLYTRDAVYVGMRMHDPAPDSIAAQLARRDAFGIYSDWAHVVIDSYNDRRTAFRFSVNPREVKKDVFHFNDTNEDLSWNPVWEVATRIDSLGWTAEFRIPLSQLRYRGEKGESTWGINFGREIARLDERVYWSPIAPNAGRYVSYSGSLTGLRALPGVQHLEIQPYAVARLTRAPGEAANPFYQENEGALSAGLDLKYGLTSDLTLTATLNPDFGQVEADPAEVNLSAYETLLSERRPFFQEGTELFNNFYLGQVDVAGGERLFYSRRIGRSPSRRITGAPFVDAPSTTTILGAAKLTGKVAGGWSLGFLSALTAPESARFFREGSIEEAPVEPLAHYSMTRLSRDFREGQSAMGAALVTTHRRLEDGGELDFLRSAAYVGGLDARHRFGGGNYEVSGFLLGSRVEGSPLAMQLTQRSSARYFQRPDATHLEMDPTRTSLSGTAANLELRKLAGGNWRWALLSNLRTPGFEANDLGFQRQADAYGMIGMLEYVQSRPGPLFRNWRTELGTGSTWSFGQERIVTATVLNGNGQLNNFWSLRGAAIRFFPALWPTLLRGGPALQRGGRNILSAGLNTDSRKKVRVGLNGSLEQGDEEDSDAWSLGTHLMLRPSTQATLSLSADYSRNRSPWQYLGQEVLAGTPHYLGGRLHQTTAAASARLDYAVTPTLTFQLYAQPFVSAGDFSDFREVVSPRARDFDEQFAPLPPERVRKNPDFNLRSLNSNAVLRWEYRPGSTLFLVWSQGRRGFLPDGSFDFARDFGGLFGVGPHEPVPATNVLLLKASYWLGR